jgi:hypothetical protein
VRAVPLAADVAQMAVGEGQRADRDDDQHPVHDHLVTEHPPEKPVTIHFLRLARRQLRVQRKPAELAGPSIFEARFNLLADLSRLSRPQERVFFGRLSRRDYSSSHNAILRD